MGVNCAMYNSPGDPTPNENDTPHRIKDEHVARH